MAKTKITINEISSDDGSKIVIDPVLSYRVIKPLATLDDNDIPNVYNLREFVSGGVLLRKLIAANDPNEYILTSPELALINAVGRIPMFVAVTAGGQQNDIYPTYIPFDTPGSYTQIKIVLHDGGGINAEDTLVQFS